MDKKASSTCRVHPRGTARPLQTPHTWSQGPFRSSHHSTWQRPNAIQGAGVGLTCLLDPYHLVIYYNPALTAQSVLGEGTNTSACISLLALFCDTVIPSSAVFSFSTCQSFAVCFRPCRAEVSKLLWICRASRAAILEVPSTCTTRRNAPAPHQLYSLLPITSKINY